MGRMVLPSGRAVEIENEGREVWFLGTDATVDVADLIWLAGYLAPGTPAQRSHAALDELLAAFLAAPENRNKLPSTTPIMALLEWSHAQLGVPS